jgi:hypothetical protein
MSIYTDMIEIIKKYGIATDEAYNSDTDNCCMLGVKALAQGTPLEDVKNQINIWNTDGIKELAQLSKEKYFEEKGHRAIFNNPDYSDVYSYNDSIIRGDVDKAIAILEEAEEMRKAKG